MKVKEVAFRVLWRSLKLEIKPERTTTTRKNEVKEITGPQNPITSRIKDERLSEDENDDKVPQGSTYGPFYRPRRAAGIDGETRRRLFEKHDSSLGENVV